MELKFYRHKEYKDLYLKRNNVCGGNETTEFYTVTRNVFEAIKSLENYSNDFLSWLKHFPENKTHVILEQNVEIDGYTGTLTKKVKLYIKDFELVTLTEKERK